MTKKKKKRSEKKTSELNQRCRYKLYKQINSNHPTDMTINFIELWLHISMIALRSLLIPASKDRGKKAFNKQ